MSNSPHPFTDTEVQALHRRVLDWFSTAARDLPWRNAATPWGVMVSEFMLQQTPVSRVLPVYEQWMARWPTPTALAGSSPGEAVRLWGRLGYPRRALRLHAAATAIVQLHDGDVPRTGDELLKLPGVGEYTAAAIESFAFQQRAVVLDTNVRRVFARVIGGIEFPANSVKAAERQLASSLVPSEGAHRWAAATMELGALVCTARAPRCDECPLASMCRWRAAGYPAHQGPARRGQAWNGTDRQCRGQLLAVLRESSGPVPKSALDAVWHDESQRERALDGLLSDGLVELVGAQSYALPGGGPPQVHRRT